MSVILNSGVFGNNGRGSIVLDKANGVRQVITPIGDTKMVVAGGSIRGSIAGMTNSIITPGPAGPIGTSFGSYGFIGGPSFPPPPPSLTLANASITPRIGLPVTVPGVPIIRTSTIGATTVGAGFSSGVQNINTFVPPVGISSGVNMLSSGISGMGGGGIITTTTADQAMLASVQRSAFGERINTVAPAFNSNQLPPLQPTVLVDIDPFTPGIQIESSAGPVTIADTTTIVGPGFNVPTAIVDADPITPGIQSQPGIITATGPSVVVGKVPSNQCCGGIFSWLLPLLCLLLLAGLLSSIYYYVKSRQQSKQQIRKSYSYSYQCGKNGFMLKGRCITCPTGSQWDGKSCAYEGNSRQQIKTKVSKVQAIEQNTTGGPSLPESITVAEDKKIESKDQKVAVFDKQNLQRGILSVPQQQGVKPQLVSTKPVASKPSVVIDSKGGDATQSSQFTSTNVVTVAPIISRKSVPVKYTYSTQGFKTQVKSKSITDQAYDVE